ncbi:MAG: glycosyltransferase [Xanthobacteraceae bacterium]|nr:glycosyltransferase [Xanthobacteraceae bacterium]
MKKPDFMARIGRWTGATGGRSRPMSFWSVVACLGLVASAHAMLWVVSYPRATAAPVETRLPSVSYNRFAGTPAGSLVPEARVRADLGVIASYARSVRTYSSTRGLEHVPEIARELGLTVTLGVWIDTDDARNEREIASALNLARRYPNVTRLVVGNETVHRKELSPTALAALVRRVKRDSPVPVATADNWRTFIEHPELVDAVDEVFAHIIPYWEGASGGAATQTSLAIYQKLRAAYPDKPIVIGEFGWPSAGHNHLQAVPGPMTQAVVLRDFVARANEDGIDYNIIEAIDQPEKLFEGNVGPYWGILDTSLRPKFSWVGPLEDPEYWKATLLAVLVGALLSISAFALRDATVGQVTLLGGADQVIGDWWAHALLYWNGHYFLRGEVIAFAIGLPLLSLLTPIVLSKVGELARVAFGRGPVRLLRPAPMAPDGSTPTVSIHIPAFREPPEMLLRSIESVARLDYPNFECIVVINNTPDPAFWTPIERRCRELGPRFKFLRVDDLAGFKAGALRLALTETSADTEIIGVIDADYIVDPQWLKDLVPGFRDPEVGLIQAPQDHRDSHRSPIHAAMNAEYAGFFDIGMVERNEVNAIIVHGTMCLIRRAALEAAGNWSSDTICEDSDLGLTILELGWQARYTNRRYGWGLLPRDYAAFKTQRARWAGGAVQIVKKHWRRFLPGGSKLDRDQKREFARGWLNWLGADVVAVAAAILNLIGVPFIVLNIVAIPNLLLTLPVIAASLLSLVHFACAYRLRVAIPCRQMLGAMVVLMSVQWTVASAAFKAAFPARQAVFVRTRKGSGAGRNSRFTEMPEAVLATLLMAGACIVHASNPYRLVETDVFAAILLIQALPFLSSVALGVFERRRRSGRGRAVALRPECPFASPTCGGRIERQPQHGDLAP